jgi:hypothetical protein
MFYQSPEYAKAVIADREREVQHMRLVRQAKQASSENKRTETSRRRRIRLRDPLKA